MALLASLHVLLVRAAAALLASLHMLFMASTLRTSHGFLLCLEFSGPSAGDQPASDGLVPPEGDDPPGVRASRPEAEERWENGYPAIFLGPGRNLGTP